MTEHTQIINQAIADAKEWLSAAGFKQGDEAMTAWELWKDERKEYRRAFKENNYIQILDGVIDCAWAWGNLSYFGHSESQTLLQIVTEAAALYPLEDVRLYAQAVKESNWSKFCKNEAEAKATVTAYYFGSHPDKPNKKIPTLYKQVGEKWVVCHEHTRKVLKSINYITVQDALKTL